MPLKVSVPLPSLANVAVVPVMAPAKAVLREVPTLSKLVPRATVVPATPDRSLIVVLPEPDTSKVAPAAARSTPLDKASKPLPVSASVPALIVVAPV